MKQAVFRLTLTALFLWAGVSCQTKDASQSADVPQSPSKPPLNLAERRVPNRPLHQLLPGVSISADRVTNDAGKKRFSGRVFVESTVQKPAKSLTPGTSASVWAAWLRYATASEAIWTSSTQTLELRGNPTIQYKRDAPLLQIGHEGTAMILSPSGIRCIGGIHTYATKPNP